MPLRQSNPILSLTGVTLTLVLVVACTQAAATPSPTASPTGPTPEPATPLATDDPLGAFTCDRAVVGTATVPRAQIIDVRVAEHDDYDRIVFEFAADTEPALPEFEIAPAEPPFYEEGSGFEIEVSGERFLSITLRGGTKQSETGGSTYDGPTEFETGYAALEHLVEGGDFEAQSRWYAGLNTDQVCIRVITLAGPSRIAIDVQH
jgi:hypothetical protein